MVTVYRIVSHGMEVYRGKRIAVVRKLATLSKRGPLDNFIVQSGTAKDYKSDPPGWGHSQPASQFLAGQ